MHLALELAALVATVIAVTTVAKRLDLPAPVLLVAVGVVAAYLPFVPEVRLTSELVLVGLLPPLLYTAALQTSLIDFRAHARPIVSLSVFLVVFTTLGVGVLVHAVVPGVDWPAAFAIGAVVAPPDAVAATAVARRIGLPRGIVTILEGESLLNDATALVALNTAILAASGAATVVGVGFDFVRAAAGGVLVGVVVFVLIGKLRKQVTDPVIDTSISIVTPFVAYVAAEEIHASGVLGVVVAGLLLGHKAPVIQSASSRIAEQLNWRTISFLLENSVFLLIGLQAHWIIGDVADSEVALPVILLSCVAVLAAVIVLRMVWVFASRYMLGKRVRRAGSETEQPLPASYATVVGWAGMRGVVTLAAAFAIPPDAPRREVLLLIALFVTAGTLALQGLSLPWLVRRLNVPPPDPREDALARAELLQQASRAGRERLEEVELSEGDEQDASVRDLLRTRLEQRDFAAWERLGSQASSSETPSEQYARLRLDMLQAERGRVLEIRSDGTVPHDVVEDVLSTLDIEESMIGARLDRRRHLMGDNAVTERAAGCEHLRIPTPPRVGDTPSGCEDCLAEGSTWVHLRTCLSCGKVGCCDSSPRRHASAHYAATSHPVIASAEPGENWRWCFVDEIVG